MCLILLLNNFCFNFFPWFFILSFFAYIILLLNFRYAYTPKQVRNKPGREVVTFLLVCNLAMWAINTLETNRADSHPIQVIIASLIMIFVLKITKVAFTKTQFCITGRLLWWNMGMANYYAYFYAPCNILSFPLYGMPLWSLEKVFQVQKLRNLSVFYVVVSL